jgi:hypothetical protein
VYNSFAVVFAATYSNAGDPNAQKSSIIADDGSLAFVSVSLFVPLPPSPNAKVVYPQAYNELGLVGLFALVRAKRFAPPVPLPAI